jgi:hypothetical protein
LRSEGAAWGLIALEQGLRTVPAPFDGIDNAVVPVGTAGSVAAVPDATTVTPTPTVQLPTLPLPTVTPPTVPGTTTDSPPVTVPPAEPQKPTNVVSTLVDGVNNLVGGLLGH